MPLNIHMAQTTLAEHSHSPSQCPPHQPSPAIPSHSHNPPSLSPFLPHPIYYLLMAYYKYGRNELGMAGCYSMPKAHNDPIELPLKSFNYDINILDSFANVTLTQIYYNPTSSPLDVQYVFPVYPNSTVIKLEVEFGGQRSEGVVLQKEQARHEYEKEVKEGGGAALGEFNPLSRDIMKMAVGNIGSRSTVKVTLVYLHSNSLLCNTFYHYKLTTAMTPRYASQRSPQEIVFGSFPNSKKMEGICTWNVSVNIRSSKKVLKTFSDSHKIKTIKSANGLNITFADPNELPNRDFTLSYVLQNFEKPSFYISNSDNNTTAAISFIPKYCQLSIDDAEKQKTFEVGLDAAKGEYIFLLDRSGSMGGIRIDNAKRALQIFLRSLPEDSYFNVVSFGSNHKYLFQDSAKNEKVNIQQAVGQISLMKADMGGTEILTAIQNLITKPVINGYPRQLFLLTDGAVKNVKDVLYFISKHTQYTRVHSIGIGNGCSELLLKGCAQRGKGYSISIEDMQQKPEQKIISLLDSALSPVISNLSLEYDNKAKVESIVPNPQHTPYVLKNDPVNFYISFDGVLTEPFVVTIKYKDTIGNSYSERVVINPNIANVKCDWLHHFVHYQKIQALVDTYEFSQSQQDRIFYVKTLNKESLREEIINLSVKHQILTEMTAFLCIDANAIDQVKKYNINHPKERINIQGMNPYDHAVKFMNEGVNQYEDEYIDECCIMEYELPLKELREIVKFEQIVKKPRPMKILGRVAGPKQTTIPYQGVVPLPNLEKQLPYAYITKRQEVNGSWSEDFIDSLFRNANDLRKELLPYTDKTSWITFLVCQYLMRYQSKEAQFAMIIKKGKNYVEKTSKTKWNQLESIFHQFYSPLKP